MRLNRGYTLIELVVAVGILAVLTTTGVMIFMRTLRASSQVEIRKTLDGRAKLVLNSLARFLSEAEATELEGVGRFDCLSAGSLEGDTLKVMALDNIETSFSVSGGTLASIAAILVQTINLNEATEVSFGKAGGVDYFTWYCLNGVPDRLRMRFKATAVGQEGDAGVSNDYDLEVVMRNSGQ